MRLHYNCLSSSGSIEKNQGKVGILPYIPFASLNYVHVNTVH